MLEALGIAMLISFILTYFAMPPVIERLREKGFAVPDMYKSGTPAVPTKGGVVVLFTSFLTLVSVGVWFRILHRVGTELDIPKDLTEAHTAMLLVVAMYSLYGMTDDLIDVGRPAKVILPIIFAYPLLIVVTPSHYTFPFYGDVDFSTSVTIPLIGSITLSALVRVIIMPVYIMVVANLMNMHSGFNGLQSGLSTIVLIFLVIKSAKEDLMDNALVASSFAGAMIAFYWFNKNPSQIFEGNIGALAIGAVIGCTIVIQGFVFSGMIMLFPHIINFLMYVRWRIMNKKYPNDEKWAISKFGRLRSDGTLEVPNPHTLKWVSCYYWRMTEKQGTHVMFAMTIVFCILGLFVPS